MPPQKYNSFGHLAPLGYTYYNRFSGQHISAARENSTAKYTFFTLLLLQKVNYAIQCQAPTAPQHHNTHGSDGWAAGVRDGQGKAFGGFEGSEGEVSTGFKSSKHLSGRLL